VVPVEQRYLAIFDENGDNTQRGDCLTACVASIFELSIEDVPYFVESDSWWGDYMNFSHDRGFQLGQVRISTDDEDPTKLNGYPTEGVYWIATVKSPRGRTRCSVCKGERETKSQWVEDHYEEYDEPQPCLYCDATGLVPSLHAVVMCGKEMVWDPHPQRDMGHLGFVSGEWFIARDPSQLALKQAA